MKRLISLIVFAAVAIIALWSTTSYFSDQEQTQTKKRKYIEIFMNEFVMTAMDEHGKPAYTIDGKRLERYNDSDDIRVDLPVIHLLEAGKQWKVSADFALLNDNNNTIQLRDNVVMLQQNIEPAMTIRTQSMMIHTNSQIAETDAEVDITQGNSKLTSSGMIYNNITSKLELTSSVSGYYLPYE
jgi:lipopolysaccharide export system protein LptC